MRCLVTGDRGYIGAVLVPLLQRPGTTSSGWTPAGTTAATSGRRSTGTSSAPATSATSRPTTCAGFDAVVHLAAISNDPVGHLNPEATYSVNADGAVHLGARGQGRRGRAVPVLLVVLAVRRGRRRRRSTRTPPFNPVTPYGESKVLAEAGHRGAGRRRLQPDLPAQRHGLRLVAAAAGRHRGQQPDRHRVHHAARCGCRATARPWRPLVHVEDIARAFLAVLEAPRELVHDQAFNVGRDEDVVQIRDIAEQVAEALGAPVTFAEGAGPDTRDYRVDFTKIHELLPAFAAAWTSPPASRSSRATCANIGLTAERLRGPPLRPAGRIRELLDAGRLDDELRHAGADRRAHQVSAMTPPLPPVRGPAHTRPSSTSACRRRARATSRPTSSTRARPSTPCTCGSATQCLLVQLPAYIPAEDIFSRLRLLLVLQRLLGGARRALRRREAVERLGLGPRLVRRRGRQQRRLPAAARRRARASAPSASSRPPTSPRWPWRRASRPRCMFLGERDRGRRSPPQHGPADLVVANNVFAHVPDIVDFAKGLRALVADDGHVSIEFPHLLRLIEGRAVRHDLPRALLVPVPADDRSGCWRRPD